MAEHDFDDPEAELGEDAIDPGSTLAKLMAENAALKDQAMRYAAEAENVRRRTEKEANDARAYAIQKFARDLLDASDNLHRAVEHAPKDVEDAAVKNFVMGVTMSEKALQTAFERNNLKRVMPEKGEKFDPNRHQAMMEQPADDVPPGSVIMGHAARLRAIRPHHPPGHGRGDAQGYSAAAAGQRGRLRARRRPRLGRRRGRRQGLSHGLRRAATSVGLRAGLRPRRHRPGRCRTGARTGQAAPPEPQADLPQPSDPAASNSLSGPIGHGDAGSRRPTAAPRLPHPRPRQARLRPASPIVPPAPPPLVLRSAVHSRYSRACPP